jgi:hypothetical protein
LTLPAEQPRLWLGRPTVEREARSGAADVHGIPFNPSQANRSTLFAIDFGIVRHCSQRPHLRELTPTIDNPF